MDYWLNAMDGQPFFYSNQPVDQGLPGGAYLATSDELAGLVAQGRTVAETLEIARDVARKLIEARRERRTQLSLRAASAQGDIHDCSGGVGGPTFGIPLTGSRP